MPAPTSSSTGSLPGLRRRNRDEILEVLRRRGSTTRSDLAERTGLSATTVSTLVGELLEQGVVVELAERTSPGTGGGRPARLLTFNPAAGGAAGVHLAHDHVRVGVTDLAGTVRATIRVDLDVDHRPTEALDRTAQLALDLVGQAGLPLDGVLGLGVAVSAPVSAATHALGANRILPDWGGVDLAAELGQRTELRVEVGNDANLGAVAEHRLGAGRHVDDLIYVMLSDGVGAGLVLNGRLYEGASGGAGELGHVPVVPGGYICRCGARGCLETVAGAYALAGALRLTRGEGARLPDVVATARDGDEGARRVLADAGRALGRALLPVCTVLDPALVLVGGEGGTSEVLVQAVQEEITRTMTPLRNGALPVRPGGLGDEAMMLGAVALVTSRSTRP